MNILKSEAYTLIKPTENSVGKFVENFKIKYSEFIGAQIIIDFSEKINIEIKDLMLFLNISTTHKENGTSFVIICDGIKIDDVPDEISIVPTLTEAIDILEMDAIERDLGF
jgi:hypothetical protein